MIYNKHFDECDLKMIGGKRKSILIKDLLDKKSEFNLNFLHLYKTKSHYLAVATEIDTILFCCEC